MQGAEFRLLPEAARTVSREGQNASSARLQEVGLLYRESKSSEDFGDSDFLRPVSLMRI